MQIVCSSSVTCGKEAFSTLGDVRLVSEGALCPAHLQDADMLITRSKVKVDHALLADSPVTFYGTATAGTDHIDFSALERLGIHAASSPGCNSRSVAEYVLSAILDLAVSKGYCLEDKTLGLIGHGNAGTATGLLAEALGLKVLKNDPPKAETNPEGYTELNDLLEQSDILSLHVPLVEEGPWPTRHLIAETELMRMKPETVLINACRGEVLDSAAVVSALNSEHLFATIIDVWTGGVHLDLMKHSFLVSPHIAGHSYEGKINGTILLYEQACSFFDLQPTWNHYTGSRSIIGRLKGSAKSTEALLDSLRKVYDIREDDARFKKGLTLNQEERVALFKKLRGNYPLRHEFHRYEVKCDPSESAFFSSLGFKIVKS